MDKFYQKFVTNLKAKGYQIENGSRVTGNGILAYILLEKDSNTYMFYADNEKCFNKLKHCPIQLEIPKGFMETNELHSLLDFYSSEEGLMTSNRMDIFHKTYKCND